MDRSSAQKVNKETAVLNERLDQIDLIDLYTTLHPNAEEYTFFSNVHGTFSRIEHMLDTKQVSVNLRRLKAYPTSFLSSVV